MRKQSNLLPAFALLILASVAACGGPWEGPLEELAKGHASNQHDEEYQENPEHPPASQCEARVDEDLLESQRPGYPTPFCDTFADLPSHPKCDDSACSHAIVWNEGQPEAAWQNISCADAFARCEELANNGAGQRYCMWGNFRIFGKRADVCSTETAPSPVRVE